MRILQLSNKVPYPPSDGGAIAVLSLAIGLADLGHEIISFSMATEKHNFNVEDIPSEFSDKINFLSVPVSAKITPKGLLQNYLFSSKPYTATRFIVEDYSLKLIEILSQNEFDIIQLEGLYLAPYIDLLKRHSKAKIVMRAHNLEFEIWQRVKENTKNPLKKLYLKNLTRKLRKFELSYLANYDLLLPITDRDGKQYKALGFKNDIYTLVTGIDASRYQSDLSACNHPTIFHLGSLDWEPNLEGLRWFLANIWPKITKKHPKIKFHIAGRNASESNINYYKSIKNVIFDGEVENANDYINSKAIMIVPLLSGSGMRIKILEGLALSKAIVTTEVGIEGIHALDQTEVMIAKDQDEFISKLFQLIENKSLFEKISKNAKAFISREFDNEQIVKKLVEKYEKLLLKKIEKKK